ncbi:carboxypeptidase-like regulatory domain-containing protein [Mucilaginibacter sp.]|uniref:carboxypeptidase-like regulatory domain-containing protein n=1 Tax=Mucilaginibacter sp. TaxID=1882438 RepID=UPI003D114AC3
MKIINLLFLLMLLSTLGFSQTISISGTVHNQQGQGVPFAFIRDAHHNYATYSDSSGVFQLRADPASSLIITAPNFSDIETKIDNKTSLSIVMTGGTSGSGSGTSAAGSGSNGSVNIFSQGIVAETGGQQVIKAGFNQEETKGSPYLFNNWVHGFAVTNIDALAQSAGNLYNYDKINGNVIYKQNNGTPMAVDKQQVKYFMLFDDKAHSHMFESAPTINKEPFIEVLVSTPKIKIYKKIETKLVRADFHTDGIITSGNKYDEYTDAVKYYYVKLPNGQPQSFSIKKKAIKEIFGTDADKFMAAQSSRDIDEDYLRDLGISLNP